MKMNWRKSCRWLLALALALGLSGAAAAQQSVTVFFESNKLVIDGVANGDKYYYPVAKLAQISQTHYNWNPTLKTLDINGSTPRIDPLIMGGQAFLPLETFVEASGLVATWDQGRGTLLLNRSSDKAPNPTDPVHTPMHPGAVGDANEMPYDSSLSGRLPAGWHYANPLEGAGPAAPPPMPGGTPPTTALLDRRQNGSGEVYVPRIGRNAAFLVTITDVERVDNLRGYYQPKSGHRFVIVYLSQKNISETAQVDPGKFYLQDTAGNNYEALDELSSHRPVIFRPYGINFGYLVYEVPEVNLPTRMILTTVGQAPLSVGI
jgi:hypothetical protein